MRDERENLEKQKGMTCHFKHPQALKLLSQYLSENLKENPLIVCIGTDRCIGDALGPLVGTLLEKEGLSLPIYGTLQWPIHALNIHGRLVEIKKNHHNPFIIAIDASLGDQEHIGNITIRKGPLYPGKGVGKKLPAVGDLSIIGIVEDITFDVPSNIHHIRLHFIMSLAEMIASVVQSGLGVKKP